MPDKYNRPLAEIAIRTVLPSIVGALGAMTATLLPVYHQTFCAGGL